MLRITTLMTAAGLVVAASGSGWAGPLDIARDAANLGIETAKKAVELGLDTAESAGDIAEDALTPDRPRESNAAPAHDCHRGERYRDADGDWHNCPS